MKKRWIFGGLLLGGVVGMVIARRKLSAPTEQDISEPASAEAPADHPGRVETPEQQPAPAELGNDTVSPEPPLAAPLIPSPEAIRAVWPSISDDEIQQAEGDLERLAQRIAEKVEQPRDEIRRRLEEILSRETPISGSPTS